MEEEQQEVVIVGAGVAGLATAVALKRLGVRCLVLERSHEIRTTGAALTLFPNAWRALDVLGVAQTLTSVYPILQAGPVTNIDTGETIEVSLTRKEGMGVRAVHRKLLSEVLAGELAPGTIRFSSKLASVKSEVLRDSSNVNVLHLEDGTVIRAKFIEASPRLHPDTTHVKLLAVVLIGCDGVQSVVAQWLGLAAPMNSGRAAFRGLAVYNEGHGLKRGAHQFLSGGKRGGVVALNANDVYWFLVHYVTPRDEAMAKDFAKDPSLILREVTENLAKDFPPLYLDVVRRSDPSSVTWAPLLFRAPWDLIIGQKAHKGGVTVAGDAMHPMTPDLGQGGCAALEDAVVLARCIGRALHAGDAIGAPSVEKGLESYVKERKWRVAGLIAGSYLSGWVQQGGSGLWSWVVRWFRDHVFYRFFYPRISAAVLYDCGELTKVG